MEALIAEMLGDIGKLHEAVKSLTTDISQLDTATRKRIEDYSALAVADAIRSAADDGLIGDGPLNTISASRLEVAAERVELAASSILLREASKIKERHKSSDKVLILTEIAFTIGQFIREKYTPASVFSGEALGFFLIGLGFGGILTGAMFAFILM